MKRKTKAARKTSPTSIRPILDAKRAELPTITGWERAFLAACQGAGGVTAKQQPTMDRINAKLKARGEPTIDLPRRKKGDPTPGQKARALGRGFADIELTRLVAEALRKAPRGLTMGGLVDALGDRAAASSVSQIYGAIEHLEQLTVVRRAERRGQAVYIAA